MDYTIGQTGLLLDAVSTDTISEVDAFILQTQSGDQAGNSEPQGESGGE